MRNPGTVPSSGASAASPIHCRSAAIARALPASSASRRSESLASSWRGVTVSAADPDPPASRARTASAKSAFSLNSPSKRLSCRSTLCRRSQAMAASRRAVAPARRRCASARSTSASASSTRASRLSRLGSSCISSTRKALIESRSIVNRSTPEVGTLSRPSASLGSGSSPAGPTSCLAAASRDCAASTAGLRSPAARMASSKEMAPAECAAEAASARAPSTAAFAMRCLSRARMNTPMLQLLKVSHRSAIQRRRDRSAR